MYRGLIGAGGAHPALRSCLACLGTSPSPLGTLSARASMRVGAGGAGGQEVEVLAATVAGIACPILPEASPGLGGQPAPRCSQLQPHQIGSVSSRG